LSKATLEWSIVREKEFANCFSALPAKGSARSEKPLGLFGVDETYLFSSFRYKSDS
jgi:hypothetical protein